MTRPIKYKLSLLLLVIPLSAIDNPWIDDFNKSRVGEMPNGWAGRGKDASLFYRIAEEKGNRFLRAHTKNSHEFVGKQVTVDIVKYPYLHWR